MLSRDKARRTMRIDVALDGVGGAPGLAPARTIHLRPRSDMRDPVADYNPLAGRDFQALLQSSYDGTIITDLKGTILDLNRRVTELVNVPREHLLGASVMELLIGADDALFATIRDTVESERHVLLQAYVMRDGADEFAAEVAVNRLRMGEAEYLCFFLRDVSLRKQVQQRLRVEHSAVQNAGTGIVITAPDGSIRYVNPAFVRLWGCEDAESMHGADVREVFADQNDADHIVGCVLNGATWEGELSARRCDGHLFYVAVSASVNLDDEDHIIGLVFSFMDVDARRQAEDALRRYQVELEEIVSERTNDLREAIRRLEKHNQEKTDFVSNVSHELRTPLASMIYATENLLDGLFGDVDERVRDYLLMIQQDCRRLTGTVQDILDLSRLESNRLRLSRRKVPVAWVIWRCGEAIRLLCEQKAQTLHVDVPAAGGFILCDQRRLERALGNVLQNAIKFTPEHGTISLCAQVVDGHVDIAVTDTGVGIPEKHLPRVMDRYYRVGERVAGTGLGLSLCREIVELHGGQVVIESPPKGQSCGTCVTLSLPLESAPRIGLLSAGGAIESKVREALGLAGYVVEAVPLDHAADGTDANHAFDAVLLDMATSMPQALTWLAAAREHSTDKHIGCVAVGGQGNEVPTELLTSMHVPWVIECEPDALVEAIECTVFESSKQQEGE